MSLNLQKELEKIIVCLYCEISSSKPLSNLSKDYILEKISKYFLREGNIRKKIEQAFLNLEEKNKSQILKNKFFKQALKEIKTELNMQYSIYLTGDFSKTDFNNIVDSKTILKLHKSSKERLPFYDEIYSRIFNWYKPKKIADLACGMNPLSFEYIEKQLNYKPEIFASDLSNKDMDFLNSFFKKNKIKGFAKAYDLTNDTNDTNDTTNEFENKNILNDDNLKNCDLVFLFKALDSVEQIKKNYSKTILERLSAKNIVVSFPTKSLFSKKNFKLEKRNWFYNFLNKKEIENGWKYEEFEVENEMFFLISK